MATDPSYQALTGASDLVRLLHHRGSVSVLRPITCLLLGCLLAAGCATASEEAELTAPDAGVAPDATKADVDNTCNSALENPAGTARGNVGSVTNKGPALSCDDVVSERIVGVALRMSNQNTVYGGRSAHGMGISCARVTILPDGSTQLGVVRTKEISGTGGSMWSPSTWTSYTECEPGWVVTGFKAHRGSSNNRFLNASIVCTRLGYDGKPTGTAQVKAVTGSLFETTNPDELRCAAGQVIAQFGTQTGAGFDGADLFCSVPSCR
jgi:hypothetical protein